MGLFGNFFSSDKLKQPVDLSLVSTDMHSHLIPGIDDGAKTMEDSVELVRLMRNLGYKKLIITPHIITDYFKNTPEIINNGLNDLRNALARENIPVQIETAAEYMLDEGFRIKFQKGELLTFGNKNILVELSSYVPPIDLFQVLFDLRMSGYKTILAHPERYSYWHNDFENYVTLKDREILFQVNLPSLAGFYAPQVQKMAEKLIENNMVEFIGSDLHDTDYYNKIEKSRFSKYLEHLLNSGRLLNKTL